MRTPRAHAAARLPGGRSSSRAATSGRNACYDRRKWESAHGPVHAGRPDDGRTVQARGRRAPRRQGARPRRLECARLPWAVRERGALRRPSFPARRLDGGTSVQASRMPSSACSEAALSSPAEDQASRSTSRHAGASGFTVRRGRRSRSQPRRCSPTVAYSRRGRLRRLDRGVAPSLELPLSRQPTLTFSRWTIRPPATSSARQAPDGIGLAADAALDQRPIVLQGLADRRSRREIANGRASAFASGCVANRNVAQAWVAPAGRLGCAGAVAAGH